MSSPQIPDYPNTLALAFQSRTNVQEQPIIEALLNLMRLAKEIFSPTEFGIES